MSEVSAIIGAISVIIVDYLVAQLDAGASLVQVGCFASETFSDPKAGELLLQLRKKQRSPSPSLTKKKKQYLLKSSYDKAAETISTFSLVVHSRQRRHCAPQFVIRLPLAVLRAICS